MGSQAQRLAGRKTRTTYNFVARIVRIFSAFGELATTFQILYSKNSSLLGIMLLSSPVIMGFNYIMTEITSKLHREIRDSQEVSGAQRTL